MSSGWRVYGWADGPRLAGVALVYALLAKIVLGFFSANGVVSIIWPPSGLALAALLAGGNKYWPSVFAGAFAVSLTLGSAMGAAACIALGGTLECLVGAWLVTRDPGFDPALRSTRDYLRLVVLAGVASPVVSALIGTGTLWWAGVLTRETLGHNLLDWWLGDALGIAVVAPFVLVWRQAPWDWFRRERALELAACLALAFLCGQAVFLTRFDDVIGQLARGYWMFLFVAWAAVRFGRHGAMLVIGMTMVQALLGVAQGIGYFGADMAETQLLNFWFYMVVLGIVGMMLALAVGELRRSQWQRERQFRQLEIMARITQLSLATESVEQMLDGVLAEVLQAFDADRAWFLYPCDPDGPSWFVPMERTRPAWPGIGALGKEIPMTAEVADVFRETLATKGVFQFGPVPWRPVPPSVAEGFSVKSGIQVVLRPRLGAPWLLGLHHCAQARIHDDEDLLVFGRIAQRVSDSLSSLISLRNLRESEKHFRAYFERSMVGMATTSPEKRWLEVNDALCQMLGYTREELTRMTWTEITYPEDRPQDEAQFGRVVSGEIDGYAVDQRFVHKDGRPVYTHLAARGVRQDDGALAYLVLLAEDISERKRADERIHYLAQHDTLTGLPNRVLFSDRLAQGIVQAKRQRTQLAVLFVDMDRFKNINDSLGHQVGDALLREVAVRLLACVRETDTVCRQGGDEFMLLVRDIDTPERVMHVAEKVLASLSQPYLLAGRELAVTPSVGIACYPQDGEDEDAIVKNADAAMYHAKQSGRAQYQFFTERLNAATHDRLAIESDLRKSLARNEFALHLQPKFDLASNAITGCEALIRWRHPERGWVAPDQFIPVAEETGLIAAIGDWVLEQACREAAKLQSAGFPGLLMSVNVSAVQLKRQDFAERVLGALAKTGLSPALLELEVTESMIMQDVERAAALLHTLHKAGVQLSVDDFGTGHSSLAYLKRLPLHTLKIDRSFVRDLATDQSDASIVQAIIALAHNLELGVVAEGVETQEQLDFLKAHGCDAAQGYWIGRPLPVEEFLKLA